MNRTTICLLALACGVLAACAGAHGDAVPIVNAGFEQRQLADSENYGEWLLDGEGWGWFGNDEIWIWNPTAEYYPPSGVPEGNIVGVVSTFAYSRGPGGFAQILSTTLAANTQYALTVEVGNTDYYAAFPGYRIELLAGGALGPPADSYPGEVTGGTLLVADNNLTPPAEDTFVTVTLSHTTGPSDPLVGQPLQIRLINLDGGPGPLNEHEVEFDAVSLTAVAVDVRIPGDANDNGFVDDVDLAILLGNWEQDPLILSTWALANFTEASLGDTDVDDADLAVLLGNWTGPPPPAGAAVPEPATIALLTLGALTLARRRRKWARPAQHGPVPWPRVAMPGLLRWSLRLPVSPAASSLYP